MPATQQDYLQTSCSDNRSNPGAPTVVGEWSISPSDEEGEQFVISNPDNVEFYKKWAAAQMLAYEEQAGWVFWSWKTELRPDFRWDYQGE